MTPYGLEHVGMLVLLALASIVLVLLTRRAEPATVDRWLRRAGWMLLANSLLWLLWGLMPWAWNLEESLPLHYSDALRIIVPIDRKSVV